MLERLERLVDRVNGYYWYDNRYRVSKEGRWYFLNYHDPSGEVKSIMSANSQRNLYEGIREHMKFATGHEW